KGFDALYGGIEISSGGQRVHLPEILIKQLKERNLDPKNFEFYINSFRWGSVHHSGWSIGLERFTMALLKLDNIREACL
ncbi:aspartate--tRNA(Asn) ligase, partial [Caldibacillus sp. 210928-DFI.2.18]|uniref:amino acid--tRNA ligase-related protein n=1 Tax=Caldibacillus sp. 210928-DFI.2.18 TaxID=2883264 RepID=UPI0027145C56